MGRKKTWREKLACSKDLPKVFEVDPAKGGRWGGMRMVVPAPAEVDALMRRVPSGCVVTSSELRRALARSHGAEVACPVTVGIFTWIAAHAAEEAAADGEPEVTPYWRTFKKDGELNPKYPGGLEAARRRLEAEGHSIEQRGNRLFVAGYEGKLAPLP